jgi:hypothetical protein
MLTEDYMYYEQEMAALLSFIFLMLLVAVPTKHMVYVIVLDGMLLIILLNHIGEDGPQY